MRVVLEFFRKHEKLAVTLLFLILTLILTWPVIWNFFSSVPSIGPDTMQVIGVSGSQANALHDQGFLRGTFDIVKGGEFGIVTLYAYFQLIFGRIVGYNLLFLASFVLSGLGAYLLALYFINPTLPQKESYSEDISRVNSWSNTSKLAALIAGLIFAFSPFHVHNSLSTNVGTMHQEWIPFFVLFLFKFFDDLKFKNFVFVGLFLFLIGFTEHQLLAFTVIFMIFFLAYILITKPKDFLRVKLWIYAVVSIALFSMIFLFMFKNYISIANSGDNFLDAGLKSAVKYSNDSLSIFIPPNFHSLWPDAFAKLRNSFERNNDSSFSVYAGYSVLLLSLFAVIMGIRKRAKQKGLFFWLFIALGFYVLSWGPYLHYKGVIDPPIRMPYWLIYNNFPFFNNIRTVGRIFVYSSLGFSMLGAWGAAFVISKIKYQKSKIEKGELKEQSNIRQGGIFTNLNLAQKIIYFIIITIIILEYLAIPLKENSLLHSSFYEKIGQDKAKYSVLEVPGSTDYNFASRDLVWKSIHRKDTVNGYDFARVSDSSYTFQRGTPIIRTLLYDIPDGINQDSDRDIMYDAYYKISNEILNYYNIRYIILDKEGLKGNLEKGKQDNFYSARAYVRNTIKCQSEYEDSYLYACEINNDEKPEHMFLAMDYTNPHWVGKDTGKDGTRRFAENGAGVKLVNMIGASQKSKLSLKLKIYKPLKFSVNFNGQEVYNKYLTELTEKTQITIDLPVIPSGENDVTFGVFAADGSPIISDKKSDTATIYNVGVD
jgi:hypothetical protein